MNILIAVPTFETIQPETFKSIYDLDTTGHDVEFQFTRGYDCAVARNTIANDCIAGGYDAVLMVDSDVTLPRDALQLLASDDVPIALGWYRKRNWNGKANDKTCVFHRAGQFGSPYTVGELEGFAASERPLVPASGGGLGCALIKTSVFERVKRPWFRFYVYDGLQTLSEDLYFALRCQKVDIQIYVDSRVGCGHRFTHIEPAHDTEA